MTDSPTAQISSLRILRNAARDASRTLWPLLRARAPLLIGLHALAFAADQYFRFAEETAHRRLSDNLGLMVTNASLAVSFDLFWHSTLFILIIQACTDRKHGITTSPLEAFMRHVNSLAIEGTRVIARILFWTPFLLLPALYQYLRLFFVNFIVVEDPRYDAGQISALERSREMSRGRAGLCFIALLIGTLTEPILSGWINGGEIALWHNPVGALLSLPVSLALNLWTLLFLFSVFEALNQLHPVPASAADPALPTTPPTEAVC